MKDYNDINGLEWLTQMCDLLSNGNCESTRKISELLGVENPKYNREKRGSKILIPKNKNLNHVAINPDLESDEGDKPVTFLSFTGPNLNLKFDELKDKFPYVELVNNTYDGGVQLFFSPVDKKYDFNAVACLIFNNYKHLDELKNLNINHISFLFKQTRIKTRAGYTMK